jgi:hypothetical protein
MKPAAASTLLQDAACRTSLLCIAQQFTGDQQQQEQMTLLHNLK